MDRNPLLGVGDLDEVLLDRVEPVLGGEERRQRHSGEPCDHVPGVPERRGHRGGVRDQSDPAAAEQVAEVGEAVEAGPERGITHVPEGYASDPT